MEQVVHQSEFVFMVDFAWTKDTEYIDGQLFVEWVFDYVCRLSCVD